MVQTFYQRCHLQLIFRCEISEDCLKSCKKVQDWIQSNLLPILVYFVTQLTLPLRSKQTADRTLCRQCIMTDSLGSLLKWVIGFQIVVQNFLSCLMSLKGITRPGLQREELIIFATACVWSKQVETSLCQEIKHSTLKYLERYSKCSAF